MDRMIQLVQLRNRKLTLLGRGLKNVKAPGVLRKVNRQIRNLERNL